MLSSTIDVELLLLDCCLKTDDMLILKCFQLLLFDWQNCVQDILVKPQSFFTPLLVTIYLFQKYLLAFIFFIIKTFYIR